MLFAAGYKYFSVIDLISSYHQLELDEESRQFTTFNTPLGLRRYKVLPYGLSVAPEIFHNVLRELFQDQIDVLTAMDDLLIPVVRKKSTTEIWQRRVSVSSS